QCLERSALHQVLHRGRGPSPPWLLRLSLWPAMGLAEPRDQHHVRGPRSLGFGSPEGRGSGDSLPKAHPELTSLERHAGVRSSVGTASSSTRSTPISSWMSTGLASGGKR